MGRRKGRAAAVLMLLGACAAIPGGAMRAQGDWVVAGAGHASPDGGMPRCSGMGGVLVPKRVKMIIGFVQRLPA